MSKKNKFEEIVSCIGSPSFRTENIAIYKADCIDGMAHIKDLSFDLTVTSPPYNIGKEYENIMPINEYIEWCSLWMNEIYRITKSDGGFWLNLGYLELPDKAKALPISYLLWDKTLFSFLQEIVWNYSAGVGCKKYFSPRNEKFLWFVKDLKKYTFNLDPVRDPNVKYPNQKKNGILKCNPLGKNPSDVWQISKVTSGTKRSSKERTKHPAQFPIELIDRIIKCSSNEEDIILDPFMGSGSTAVVANMNNRYCIGFEVKDDYIQLIKDRFSTLDMFI